MEVVAVRIGEAAAEPTFGRLLEKVAEEKRARILRFRNREDAARTLVADLLVRAWAIERLGLFYEDVVFEANDYGKPAFARRGGTGLANFISTFPILKNGSLPHSADPR